MKKSALIIMLILIMTVNNAHAYLDPGTGGILVQLLLGGFVGIGIIMKLYWKKFSNLFVNKNKKKDKLK